jgi:hypothetical protein
MDDITYYFGAGASCKSMPLVADFKERFQYFIDQLRFLRSPDIERFLNDCQDFLKSVSVHFSFDTYFKKLFHQGNPDLSRKNKALLLIYFIFEHLIEVPQKGTDTKSPMDKKENNPDPRYEALIAGLLKPIGRKAEFYTRVNFITWNYDIHISEAIRSFLDPANPIHNFINDHGNSITNDKTNKIYINSEVAITHLNGFINHPVLNNGSRLTQPAVEEILHDLIKEYCSHNGDVYNYSKSISFSWENIFYENSEPHMPAFIQEAHAAIKRSNNIIICGYSFPLYNRLIDSYLLSHQTLTGKTLYIQSPNARDIKEILINDLNIRGNIKYISVGMDAGTYIKTIPNCDSFFVPNTIFKTTSTSL